MLLLFSLLHSTIKEIILFETGGCIVADMQDGIWLLTQDENGLLAHSSFHAGDDAEACSLDRGFGPMRWRPQGIGDQDDEVVKQQAKNGCPQLAEGGSGWGELRTPKQEKDLEITACIGILQRPNIGAPRPTVTQ